MRIPLARFGLLVPLLVAVSCGPKVTDAPMQGDASAMRPSNVPEHAADVVRSLLEAMFIKDRAAVEALTLPHPDRHVLWAGPEPSALAISDMLEDLQLLDCRVPHSGEVIPMPGGGYVAAPVPGANPDAIFVLVRPRGALGELPFPLERHNGRWRVDPAPLIAARR